MPKVVRFLRLDGGSASVDLNQCIEYPVMSPPRHRSIEILRSGRSSTVRLMVSGSLHFIQHS